MRGFIPAVREVWRYRELLGALVHKELKVKYKNSFLGFLWSLLRPLCQLLIYWLVLGKFLRSNIPNFGFYLFSGLIAWDLFGSTLSSATTSIVSNAGLIKKVYFPREILPLASVGAGLVHFALQLVVVFGVFLTFRFDFFGPNLALLPVAIVALVAFLVAMSLLLSAANVYLRDVQHLIEVLLLFWFWLTPIVYPVNVLYQAGYSSYLARLLAVIVCSTGLIWLAQRIFARAQGNFAQEL
ncbi:MAG: ABC transporter permease [Actinobacteria bacterium]|nr:ABC transporter permease [Actinomycetota bacterium]